MNYHAKSMPAPKAGIGGIAIPSFEQTAKKPQL
jgi:hypothetical protein